MEEKLGKLEGEKREGKEERGRRIEEEERRGGRGERRKRTAEEARGGGRGERRGGRGGAAAGTLDVGGGSAEGSCCSTCSPGNMTTWTEHPMSVGPSPGRNVPATTL